ncbi:DUF1330 domain-containing protein [Pseudomonas sp. RtIB026]|nr:DUF1330 domain-containing protein [Pseudomonas sp. RtIB026]
MARVTTTPAPSPATFYQDACRHRQGVALAQVIIVEGLTP